MLIADAIAMNEARNSGPGPIPEGEAGAAENAPFVSTCMAVASDYAEACGWRLRNSVLTRSDIWGFVWRIDFVTKDQDQNSKCVARMVCWSAQGDHTVMGTATYFAQSLEPL